MLTNCAVYAQKIYTPVSYYTEDSVYLVEVNGDDTIFIEIPSFSDFRNATGSTSDNVMLIHRDNYVAKFIGDINKHIQTHFQYPEDAKNNKIQGNVVEAS